MDETMERQLLFRPILVLRDAGKSALSHFLTIYSNCMNF